MRGTYSTTAAACLTTTRDLCSALGAAVVRHLWSLKYLRWTLEILFFVDSGGVIGLDIRFVWIVKVVKMSEPREAGGVRLVGSADRGVIHNPQSIIHNCYLVLGRRLGVRPDA